MSMLSLLTGRVHVVHWLNCSYIHSLLLTISFIIRFVLCTLTIHSDWTRKRLLFCAISTLIFYNQSVFTARSKVSEYCAKILVNDVAWLPMLTLVSGGFRNLEKGIQPLVREAHRKFWHCHAHFGSCKVWTEYLGANLGPVKCLGLLHGKQWGNIFM